MDKIDDSKESVPAMGTSESKIQTRILYDACPLCASKELNTLLSADCTKHLLYNAILDPVMTWKKCAACAHIFIDGYFTEAASQIIFSKTHENQKVGNDMERQRYVSAKMVERVLPFVQSGYWLDIGFGNGSLLFTAHEYGFTPVGVDLRENNVSTIRKFGIEAHNIDINKLDHTGRYSVISMADVLEHVPYPKECLASVHKLLNKDGITLISMPNADSIVWQAMNKMNANPYWAEIEHFHNFGKDRLYSLLRECGFEPLSYGISERYRICMEIVARKSGAPAKDKNIPFGIPQVMTITPQGSSSAARQERKILLDMDVLKAAKGAPTPSSPQVTELLNQSNTLLNRGRAAEALAACEKAIALKPDNADAYFSRGNALKRLQRWNDAVKSYDQAIALNPKQFSFYLNKANTLRELNRLDDALKSYDQAIALNASGADAYNGKGATLRDLRRSKEALDCYNKAIAADPKSASAFVNRGNLFRELKRLDEALLDYNQVLALKPGFDFLEGTRQHTRMQLCDWTDYNTATANLAKKAGEGLRATIPFPLLTLPSSATEQLACAKTFTASLYPPLPPVWKGEIYQHKKIKIAYLSSDFYEHATAYLMAGLFELHDKSRFETVALCFGTDDKSKMRQRLLRVFYEYIDVKNLSDEAVARLVREKEIDILVDLKGFTHNARIGIMARRAAPVQVNYLGYPGTMGAPYIDYIIADPILIPNNDRAFYQEKIVCLPDSYQPNDRKRVIADKTPTKQALGLPEQGFVFCSFNSSYKITPDVFDIWMRLLKNVDGSVLWLLESSKPAANNLRMEAKKRGIEPDRIVFATHMPLDEHLARHMRADLFLDTLPCNAHTTASDALWAGLPVLTCMGQTFASRVAGSLLYAAGLPELVTQSLEEYEQLALKLAREPQALAAIKAKLATNRDTCALFDTARYTRNLEAAYTKMWECQQRGESPKCFGVQGSK